MKCVPHTNCCTSQLKLSLTHSFLNVIISKFRQYFQDFHRYYPDFSQPCRKNSSKLLKCLFDFNFSLSIIIFSFSIFNLATNDQPIIPNPHHACTYFHMSIATNTKPFKLFKLFALLYFKTFEISRNSEPCWFSIYLFLI